jgi:hypothetical protein
MVSTTRRHLIQVKIPHLYEKNNHPIWLSMTFSFSNPKLEVKISKYLWRAPYIHMNTHLRKKKRGGIFLHILLKHGRELIMPSVHGTWSKYVYMDEEWVGQSMHEIKNELALMMWRSKNFFHTLSYGKKKSPSCKRNVDGQGC